MTVGSVLQVLIYLEERLLCKYDGPLRLIGSSWTGLSLAGIDSIQPMKGIVGLAKLLWST
jgi:hypothetical protein